jgi:hypothetical protein
MSSEPVRTTQQRSLNKSAAPGQNLASHEANKAELQSLPTRRADGLQQSGSTVAPSGPAQPAENNQSKATGSASDQAADGAPVGGCMPMGITAGGVLVFPLQCRELLEKYRAPHPAPEPRTDLTPAAPAQQNQNLEAFGSVRDQQASLPSTGAEVDQMPGTTAKPAIDGSRMIEGNGNRKRKVLQSSRTRNNRPSREHYPRMLQNPLLLDCIACLIFDP